MAKLGEDYHLGATHQARSNNELMNAPTHGPSSEHIPVPRQVAVAVAYQLITAHNGPSRLEYLLVSSRKRLGSWVLPKGGVEEDEVSNHGLAALREAWEEGGIRGELVHQLHRSADQKSHPAAQKLKTFIPRAVYSFWLIKVDQAQVGISSSWPEQHERDRRWVGREQAIELVRWRQDGAVDALLKVDEPLLLGHSTYHP